MPRSQFLEVENPFLTGDDTGLLDFESGLIPQEFKSITPIPGFCVKARTESNEKLFLNVCHSGDVPPPPESFNINAVLQNKGLGDAESLFKFPLSIGEAHSEVDKTGNACRCFDVVLNSGYFEEVSKSEMLRDFITTLTVTGIERKYDINIDVGTCVVLNKKYHGQMPPHYIKLKPTTESAADIVPAVSPTSEEVVMPVKNPLPFTASPDPEILHFKLFRHPGEGQAELLIYQGLTRGVKDRKSIRVFVSKETLVIRSVKHKAIATVRLPFSVDPERVLSNFRQNRLIVAMPVLKESEK